MSLGLDAITLMNFGLAMGTLHIGENDMKPVNSLFLITVGRLPLLSNMRKLLLYFLIPIGIGLMTGCDRDIEDLSQETLSILSLTPDKEIVHFNQVIKVTAQVNYSDDPTELSYRWMAEKGKIHNHSTPSNSTERKKTEGVVIIDIEATYIAPEKTTKETDIDKIIFEVYNKGITVSSVALVHVSMVDTSPTTSTSNTPGTTEGNDEESENDETNP